MTDIDQHLRKPERMYLQPAPVNIDIYGAFNLSVSHERLQAHSQPR